MTIITVVMYEQDQCDEAFDFTIDSIVKNSGIYFLRVSQTPDYHCSFCYECFFWCVYHDSWLCSPLCGDSAKRLNKFALKKLVAFCSSHNLLLSTVLCHLEWHGKFSQSILSSFSCLLLAFCFLSSSAYLSN